MSETLTETYAGEDQLEELEAEVVHYMQQAMEHKEHSDRLSGDLSAVIEEKDRLQNELQLASSHNSKSKDEYEEKIKLLQRRILELETSLGTTDGKLTVARKLVTDLRVELQKARQETERHKAQLEDVQQTSKTLGLTVKRQFAELEQAKAVGIKQMDAALRDARSALSESRAALKDMQAQYSSELASKLAACQAS